MSKKIKARTLKQDKKPINKQQMPALTPDQSGEKDTDPFDFGGLPSRDLKKNLGCGF